MRFVPDHAGIEAVKRSPGIKSLIDNVTGNIAAGIRTYAPRGFMRYSSSIHAIPAEDTPTGPVGYAGSSSPVWHLPEYGTASTRARSPIRRAARDAGLRLEE